MEVGAGVWYKDKSDGWCPAAIVKKDDSSGLVKFLVEIRKGAVKEDVTVTSTKDSEPDSLKLMNSAEDSEVENLINLPFLHEPAILYCLELRYSRSEIYTYTGPILIAMNPFKKVDLYSDKLLDTYFKYGIRKAQGMVEDPLPPHIFAIADSAYRFMMNAIESNFGGKGVSDQSILISGESGAGKTESTKIVLRYLTTVASDAKEIKVEGSIMDKVLKSNPILEALGNAKTIRNDNSSRFGKFIELKFNDKGHLIGGFIRTYLLEKVRLTSQQLNERNFHIFYQMGVSGTFPEKERWGLKSLRDFNYVNQGQCFGIERINDERDFSDLRGALKTLRFDEDDVHNMFDIIAGLLHLGQLKFEAVQGIGEDSSCLSKDTAVATSLSSAMKLLGIRGGDFLKTVTERTIVARTDKYQKKLTVIQASDARDSISRIVYGKLFDWVVATINKEIKSVSESSIRSEIAVLDIFGFECLTENSFEQLCINYTNETLQQQFNQFIFKLEQIEYEQEGIEWSFISFPDNQDCIDLIESKKKSIFRVLDEECMTAAGTDTKFHGRLMLELGEFDRLLIPDKLKVLQKFSINHYAGEVVYSTKTFVDKNKDELPKESIDLMAASSIALLRLIFTTNFGSELLEVPNQKGNALASPTICTQFKVQLGSLMSKINSTKPHYIRCLKPNDQNKPDLLNRVRTTEQLRYGGVLEAVRVARSGFPVRLSHEEFYARYRSLANPFRPAAAKLPRYGSGSQVEQAKLCISLLDFIRDETLPKLSGNEKDFVKLSRKLKEVSVIYSGSSGNLMDLSSIQLGKTKVFFRKPAYDFFESRKSKHSNITVRRLQAQIRKWLARIGYIKLLKAVRRLQLAFRYFLFHRRFVKKRRNDAAIVIQTRFRGSFHSKHYKLLCFAVLSSQALFRGLLGRKIARELAAERSLALKSASLVAELAVETQPAKFNELASEKVEAEVVREEKEAKDKVLQETEASRLKEAEIRFAFENTIRQREEEAVSATEEVASLRKQVFQLEVEKSEVSSKLEEILVEKQSLIVTTQEYTEKIQHLEADLIEFKLQSDAQTLNLKEQLVLLNSEKEKLELALKLCSGDLSTKSEECCALTEKLSKSLSATNEYRESLLSLESKALELAKEKSEYSDKLATADQLLLVLETEKSAVAAEAEVFRQNLIEKSTLYSDISLKLEEKICEIDSVKSYCSLLETRVRCLEVESIQSTSEVSILRNHFEEAEKKCIYLESENIELYAKQRSLQQSLEAAELNCSVLAGNDVVKESELNIMSSKLTELFDMLNEKDKNLQEATSKLFELTETTKRSESEKNSLSSNCCDLIDSLKLKTQEIITLRAQNEEYLSELNSLRNSSTNAEANAMVAESTSKDLVLQLAQVKERYLALEQERSQLHSEVRELRAEKMLKENATLKQDVHSPLRIELDNREILLADALSSISALEVQTKEQLLTIQDLTSQLKDFENGASVRSGENSGLTSVGYDSPESEEEFLSKMSPDQVLFLLQEFTTQKDDLERKNIEKDETIAALHHMISNLESSCSQQEATIEELRCVSEPVNYDAIVMSSTQMKDKEKQIDELTIFLKSTQQESEQTRKERDKYKTLCADLDSKLKELDAQNKRKDDTLSSTVRYLHKQTFNSRSEDFKIKMSEGLAVKVFSIGVPDAAVFLSISRNPLLLTFCNSTPAQASRFRFFQDSSTSVGQASRINGSSPSTITIPAISVKDIRDLESGLTREAAVLFPSLTNPINKDAILTLTYKPNMVIALIFENVESRNFFLNGLKIVLAEIQLDEENPINAASLQTQQEEAPADINEKYARLMAQVLSLTNDVMEREEELIVLRSRAKAHEKEDLIRGELSRRLGEILVQKECLVETLKEHEEL